jgi:acetoin utilization deacetylase AcuC-like enzyme
MPSARKEEELVKIVTSEAFRRSYKKDPAAAPGRIDALMDAAAGAGMRVEARPATRKQIAAVHHPWFIDWVKQKGLYEIAALAAGAALEAARIGLDEPAFALARPPGHHAGESTCWGFCYFNNVAVALQNLYNESKIQRAYVLDFDMHFGDGTVSVLKPKGYVTIHNPVARDRENYLDEVYEWLTLADADLIAVSAGFDNHLQDWGGVLWTEDYRAIGRSVREACERLGAGCFAALEGGYNPVSMAESAKAFMDGLGSGKIRRE